MRRIIRNFSLMVVALLILAVPVLAEEFVGSKFEQEQQVTKDECLIVAMNCERQGDSINQRIDWNSGESARETDVNKAVEQGNLNRDMGEPANSLEDESMTGNYR